MWMYTSQLRTLLQALGWGGRWLNIPLPALQQEFYEKRTSTKNASIKEHREAHKLLGDQKPEGKIELERAIRCV